MNTNFVVFEIDHSFRTQANHVFDTEELANEYIREHKQEIEQKGYIAITREVTLEKVNNYQTDIIDKGLYENFKKNGCIIREVYSEYGELMSKQIEDLDILLESSIVWYYSWIKFIL